jgi:hypothetical protein
VGDEREPALDLIEPHPRRQHGLSQPQHRAQRNRAPDGTQRPAPTRRGAGDEPAEAGLTGHRVIAAAESQRRGIAATGGIVGEGQ